MAPIEYAMILMWIMDDGDGVGGIFGIESHFKQCQNRYMDASRGISIESALFATRSSRFS